MGNLSISKEAFKEYALNVAKIRDKWYGRAMQAAAWSRLWKQAAKKWRGEAQAESANVDDAMDLIEQHYGNYKQAQATAARRLALLEHLNVLAQAEKDSTTCDYVYLFADEIIKELAKELADA
jgi:hypothetical protein